MVVPGTWIVSKNLCFFRNCYYIPFKGTAQYGFLFLSQNSTHRPILLQISLFVSWNINHLPGVSIILVAFALDCNEICGGVSFPLAANPTMLYALGPGPMVRVLFWCLEPKLNAGAADFLLSNIFVPKIKTKQ